MTDRSAQMGLPTHKLSFADPTHSRDRVGEMFLESLPYPPYPFQEQAIMEWFTHPQGILVCAPTGMGKTLIAHSALFEALHTGKTAYYTTPLIALSEQKFAEVQAAAEKWGFPRESVGLVTGNRRVNPHARVLVVVAEILLNRLLDAASFRFDDVSAVVMDEFHSFADPQRGIVWELTLSLLPKHVRLLLLSATVGNAPEFAIWLARNHQRDLQVVASQERKVPLSYQWIGDRLLTEHVTDMAAGPTESRKTPALVFCFNRDECWGVAEVLKGLPLLGPEQRAPLMEETGKLDWKTGVGPKLRELLKRGVGVHHAGLLPKYRRAVEDLFERKLLGVTVCTETLAAGLNLPARSVVLASLMKGPPGQQTLIDASVAHQIFGRAGRPQFDTQGFVYAVAHDDDVKLHRWRLKFDAIPEDTRDPNLIRAKKDLKRKKPERSTKINYWTEDQFRKLQNAPPTKLYSKGALPWRLLAYWLKASPEVSRLRSVIRKRFMDAPRIAAGERQLDQMLLTLSAGGYVTLEPPPPGSAHGAERGHTQRGQAQRGEAQRGEAQRGESPQGVKASASGPPLLADALTPSQDSSRFGSPLNETSNETPRVTSNETPRVTSNETPRVTSSGLSASAARRASTEAPPTTHTPTPNNQQPTTNSQQPTTNSQRPTPNNPEPQRPNARPQIPPLGSGPEYRAEFARPTPRLDRLSVFRAVHPLFGSFVIDHLAVASREELIQVLEGVLELPKPILRYVRLPWPEELPPGPLERDYLDPELIVRGLIAAPVEPTEPDDAEDGDAPAEEEDPRFRQRPPSLMDKLRLLFGEQFPDAGDLVTQSVWCAGELLRLGGDFDKYIASRDLLKQEGLVYRHFLRLILLCEEFAQLTPTGLTVEAWQGQLHEIAEQLTATCRRVDPTGTDQLIEQSSAEGALGSESELLRRWRGLATRGQVVDFRVEDQRRRDAALASTGPGSQAEAGWAPLPDAPFGAGVAEPMSEAEPTPTPPAAEPQPTPPTEPSVQVPTDDEFGAGL